MSLSPTRVENLGRRLTEVLAESEFRLPTQGESEPQYTSRVLAPAIRATIHGLVGLSFQLRGDGFAESAIPARILGMDFFPDLAVSSGADNLWAAEVKILGKSQRQNATATAIGQAQIYLTRYRYAVVFLVDTAQRSEKKFPDSSTLSQALGVQIVRRTRRGEELAPCQVGVSAAH